MDDLLLARAKQLAAQRNYHQAYYLYFQYFKKLHTQSRDGRILDEIEFSKMLQQLSVRWVSDCNYEMAITHLMQALELFPRNTLILLMLGVMFVQQEALEIAKEFCLQAAREGDILGEKNYMHILWLQVPRWHFRMLNDFTRNRAFQLAINRAIDAGYSDVLDIGAGCGLLSLIAASNTKTKSVVAFEESEHLFSIASNIIKNNSLSCPINLRNELSTSYLGPPLASNLIVTEIFDVGLFGEGALESIHHALTTFTGPQFKIIPARAILYVTGIQSDKLYGKFRYMNTLPDIIVKNLGVRIVDGEPYEGEHLGQDKVKYVTSTLPFLSVDFTNKIQLSSLLDNNFDIPEINLECVEDGTVHGLAIWFDLMLDDSEIITTNPNIDSVKCWEQALIYLDCAVALKKGEKMRLKPAVKDQKLTFDLISPTSEYEEQLKVSKEVIAALGDLNWISAIKSAVDSFVTYELTVLDFNAFPLFGILMGQRGCTSYCIYKLPEDIVLYENLFDKSTITFILESEWGDKDLNLKGVDVVFPELVSTDGTWSGFFLNRQYHFRPDTIVLPKTVILQAQLITSPYIDYWNRVDDEKALSFGVAKFLNCYTGLEHPNLDSLEYEALSSVASFDVTDWDDTHYNQDVVIQQAGKPNAILFWFNFQLTELETCGFSTKNSTRYNRACSLISEAKLFNENDTVTLFVERDSTYGSYMKVFC